jgi:hypothetical protein
MNKHPTKYLRAPDGTRAAIDVMLAPLIKALWAAGYETITCCQDVGEYSTCERSAALWKGYALLDMPIEDTCRLLDAIKNTPQFRDRMHWAADGAWNIDIPILPFGWDGDAEPSPWAQIRFPNAQVGDLVDVLSREPLVLVTE